jgi:hypothetical protein
MIVVTYVPTFSEHHHGNDAPVRARIIIQFARQLSKRQQIIVADFLFALNKFDVRGGPSSPFLEFPLEIGVQVDSFAVEFGKRRVRVEAAGNFVGRACVLRHDEQERLATALFPFLFRRQPAMVA